MNYIIQINCNHYRAYSTSCSGIDYDILCNSVPTSNDKIFWPMPEGATSVDAGRLATAIVHLCDTIHETYGLYFKPALESGNIPGSTFAKLVKSLLQTYVPVDADVEKTTKAVEAITCAMSPQTLGKLTHVHKLTELSSSPVQSVAGYANGFVAKTHTFAQQILSGAFFDAKIGLGHNRTVDDLIASIGMAALSYSTGTIYPDHLAK